MENSEEQVYAGTPSKGDVQVWLKASTEGLTIDLKTKSEQKYGTHIRDIIKETAEKHGLKNAHFTVEEDSSLDFVIEARIECAILRAKEKGVINN